MQIFSALEPTSQELIQATIKKMGLVKFGLRAFKHPQEDCLSISKKYPIFVVADGVTLELKNYVFLRGPSGAGEVARIFCETFIKESEKNYKKLNAGSIKNIFSKANQAVGKYNKLKKRTKKTINYSDFDLFACTAAFAIIKNNLVYWGSICDSYIEHLDKSGKRKLISPDGWLILNKNLPKDWLKQERNQRRKILRQVYRNGLDNQSKKIGYGVVTGEANAEKYLNTGQFNIKTGEFLTLYTDGFEEYLKLTSFKNIFKRWPKTITDELKKFGQQKYREDPDKFGHERSIIVAKY